MPCGERISAKKYEHTNAVVGRARILSKSLKIGAGQKFCLAPGSHPIEKLTSYQARFSGICAPWREAVVACAHSSCEKCWRILCAAWHRRWRPCMLNALAYGAQQTIPECQSSIMPAAPICARNWHHIRGESPARRRRRIAMSWLERQCVAASRVKWYLLPRSRRGMGGIIKAILRENKGTGAQKVCYIKRVLIKGGQKWWNLQ